MLLLLLLLIINDRIPDVVEFVLVEQMAPSIPTTQQCTGTGLQVIWL